MNVRSQAQDAADLYFSRLDPYSSNDENIRNFLSEPLLAVTLSTLHGPPLLKDSVKDSTSVTTINTNIPTVSIQEEKKNGTNDWRDYLQQQPYSSSNPSSEKLQDAYNSLSGRAKARMEAFLAGCILAAPSDIIPRKKEDAESMVYLQDALSGFGRNKIGKRDLMMMSPISKTPSKQQQQQQHIPTNFKGKTPIKAIVQSVMTPTTTDNTQKRAPQISESDLILRLDLYIRTLQRVKNLNKDCVIAMETPKIIKIRAKCITNAFVTTAGCVRSMSAILTKLLNCLTMEIIAIDTLSEDIKKVIRRIVLEYEHGTSFASLTFLSTPERNAESLLMPLLMKYLRYLQSNFEHVIQGCELERMMSKAIDSQTRKIFKTIEFQSIGHLLEVCHYHQSKLYNIQLPPDVCATAENINMLCDDPSALRQALRDLQREVISINGQVLPHVTSRKQLLRQLQQALNSKPTLKENRKGPTKKTAPKELALSLSSEYDGSTDDSTTHNNNNTRSQKKEMKHKVNRKNKIHLSTIDLVTRRLLVAASRTGSGGDAYFIVRDLFGGEDVEVVPTSTLPITGSVRPGTIDILVRSSSVTIKVFQSFDVYPKSLVGECEPLIQFHTTTTETIYLEEVRAEDSDDEDYKIDTQVSPSDNLPETRQPLMRQELKTERTGWRSISIRPALYEKVEVWNTLS